MKILDFFKFNKTKDFISLIENRTVLTRKEILEEGCQKGYNSELTVLVIDFILEYVNQNEVFPISYNDNILLDYKIDVEDLGDFYRKTLKHFGIKVPKRKKQDEFMKGKKEEDYTVSLVIEFIEWCIKESASK